MLKDSLQGFLLNKEEYRGVLVRLNDSYQEIIQAHAYPFPIAQLLGEGLVAVALLGSHLKRKGKLILQIETPDCVRLLATEINERHGIRGLAQWRDEVPFTKSLLVTGQFAITLMPIKGESYQGIVPLVQHSMAKSLEQYFQSSEQVYSRILLACDGKAAAGLLLQRLPQTQDPSLDHETLDFFLNSLQLQELLYDESEVLLYKLFHEQLVEIFPAEPIKFECTCNYEKMQAAVRMLGKEEALTLLSTHKTIDVTCEYCNHSYQFDRPEVESIFGRQH